MVETGVNRGSEFSFKAGWRYVSTSVFPIMHFSSSSPFSSPLNLICGNPSLPQPMKNILAEVTVAPKGLRDRSWRITPSKGNRPVPKIINIAAASLSLSFPFVSNALKFDTTLESCLVSITHILLQDPCLPFALKTAWLFHRATNKCHNSSNISQ